MSMIPMPTCVELWLNSLTGEEKAEVLRWLDYGRCTDDEMRSFLLHPTGTTHAAKLFSKMQGDFREAARENVIISKCIQITHMEGMWMGFAWLSASMALLEQNRTLMENAQALIGLSQPPIFLEPSPFVRAMSPEPRDGYVPHLSAVTGQHEGMWQESDETFKQRIQKTYGEPKR